MAVVASPINEKSPTESPVDLPRRSSPSASPSAKLADAIGDASSDSSSSGGDQSSDRRELDLINQGLVARSEEYRLLFRLPCDEVLVTDFNCALQDNILLQGHMYLFVRHICFYSNIFGYETKKIISLNEVTDVRKAKTAGIFPNAIEITAGGKKNFFGSFLSRDEAYRLITEGWAEQNPNGKAFLDRQDSRFNEENVVGLNEAKEEADISFSGRIVEANGSVSKSIPNGSTSNNNNNVINNNKVTNNNTNGIYINNDNVINNNDVNNNNEEEIIILKKPNDDNETNENGNDANAVPKDVFIWQNEDINAPKVPEDYTLIAQSKFPVGVEEFYKLFFSDDAFDFLDDVHKKCGDKEFQVSKWTKNEQNVYTRNVSLQHPIKIYLGAKFGSTKQVQKLRIYKDNHLVVETSQTISDAPFGDYFSVEGRWDLEQDSNGCKLNVYLYVLFTKRTMFKGKIDQATKDECKDVYNLWIKLAKEKLANKVVSEPKDDTNTATIIRSLTVDPNQTETLINNESNLDDINPTENVIAINPQIAPEVNRIVYTENSTQFNSDKSSSDSSVSISTILRDILSVFLYYTKSTRFPAFLLAAFVALIILMQVSIIIMLTRSPNVYVLSEGNNYMGGNTGSYTREATEFLEKRFSSLKEEMGLVESQMERMRHEYSWLKSHLETLERFGNDKS